VLNVPLMQPIIRCFPSQDRRFADEVQRACDAVHAQPPTDGAVERVVDQVRRTYPNMTIQQQDDFGTVLARRPVWYAYRDGRVKADDWRRERLYAALVQARTVVMDSERILSDCQSTTRTAGFGQS
jgi:hypothetical protein